MARRITPVILSGGPGQRLWPLSRPERPKQMLGLTDQLTMLQLTALRCIDPDRFEAPIIVASAAQAAQIEDQLHMIRAHPSILLLEPAARNTAPAIALAAIAALDADPDALLLVMPSDHVVNNPQALLDAATQARDCAEQGWLVTFGVRPDRPETGYGYIRVGDPIEGAVHEVARFEEKPDAETAAAYVADGGFLWNSGIFLFRGDAFLAALANHAPEMAAAARKSMDAAGRRGKLLFPEPKSFAQSPSNSIDYAILEKSNSVAVIPVDMGWSDVGSWDSLYALGDTDADGNLVRGDGLALESRGCLLHSEGPTIAVHGVEDLIVVADEKAVLVLPRGKSQAVRQIVDALNARDAKR